MKLNRVVLTGNGAFMVKYGIYTPKLFTNHMVCPVVDLQLYL